MMNKISILFLIVFAVGCGTGFAPDLSNLEKSGTLVVQVNDQNDVPVNGAEVKLGGKAARTQVTGSMGEAFFLLVEGTYTISINPPNNFRAPATRTVQVKRNQTTRVVVKLG